MSAATDYDLIPVPIQRKVPVDTWRPPADIRMISADDHNLEVDHLWEERLPAKFKDRAPKFWRDKDDRPHPYGVQGARLLPTGHRHHRPRVPGLLGSR